MRIKKKLTKKTVYLVLGIAALLILGGVVAYALTSPSHHTTPEKGVSSSAATKSSASTPRTSTNSTSSPNSDNTVNKTDDDGGAGETPDSASLSTQIVSAVVNNGNIHVGTLVNGTASGSCILIATQGQQTVTLGTADVQQDVSNYDCGVFNVATTQLPASGAWKLTLTITSGNSKASSSMVVHV